MKWSFHPEADTEFHEAIDYYEACEFGLGAVLIAARRKFRQA